MLDYEPICPAVSQLVERVRMAPAPSAEISIALMGNLMGKAKPVQLHLNSLGGCPASIVFINLRVFGIPFERP
jgi:hypothetical protein